MANVARLNVLLTASSKGLSAGLTNASRAVDKFAKRVNRQLSSIKKDFAPATRSITSVTKSLALGATAAGVALGYLTKRSIDAVGDSNDLAKSLGITYTSLKTLQIAASMAGVETGAFSSALAKMSDALGTAFSGNEAAVKAFENIGLSIEDLKRMNPEQQFQAIGEAINKIQDPAARMAAARDIFGKSGGALISLFGNVGQSITDASKAVDMFGIGLSQIDVEKIDAAGDSMGTLSLIFEGVGNQLARVISPYISQIVNDTIQWIDSMGGVGPAVDKGFGYAVDVIDEMLNVIEEIELAWIKATKAANDFYLNIYGNDPNSDIEQLKNKLMTDKRLEGVAPDKREEFARRLAESGGFQSESPNAAAFTEQQRMNEDYGTRVADIQKRRAERGALGQRFAQWRKKADANANIAAGMVPDQEPTKYKKHVADGYKSKIPEGVPGYESKIPTGNDYLSKIPSGSPDYMSKIPQGTPEYVAKMTPMANQANESPMGGGEVVNLLRGIYQNTGKNAVGFAG